MKKKLRIWIYPVLWWGLLAGSLAAAGPATDGFKKVAFGCPTLDLTDFTTFARRAQQSGATHVSVMAWDLPRAFWQLDTPGDPYPTWQLDAPGLLKLNPPPELRSYIPSEYSDAVMQVLEARCQVLRSLGLKAVLFTGEAQMLPEQVFRDHPLWRGARVDHPLRSRVARFAPSLDHPEVLDMYRRAVTALIRRCPEIDILVFFTNDSGTGLDWSPGLYSGPSGDFRQRSRPMVQRLRGFLSTLQQGARDAGGSLEITAVNTGERDVVGFARQLDQGMAIEMLEGPKASPFLASVGTVPYYYLNPFWPVQGIPNPFGFLRDLQQSARSPAPRLLVGIQDRLNQRLLMQLYDRFWKSPSTDEISQLSLLKSVAAELHGEPNAGRWLSLWIAVDEIQTVMRTMTFGGQVLELGGVHQRWITRPLVPFPEELTSAEKNYYRKFQFQARSEHEADNLIDMQASRFFEGWSGHGFASRLFREVRSHLSAARARLGEITKDASDNEKSELELLALRFAVFDCLITNAENVIHYQAQLDQARSGKAGGAPSYPGTGPRDRQLMLETARREIDNTASLISLLQSAKQPVLHLAPTKATEAVDRLGPDLVEQLRLKLNTMSAHWQDYNRLFDAPNP